MSPVVTTEPPVLPGNLKLYINRDYIMGGFVYEDVISATSERSKWVADIISEWMDKNHIQIHPLL